MDNNLAEPNILYNIQVEHCWEDCLKKQTPKATKPTQRITIWPSQISYVTPRLSTEENCPKKANSKGNITNTVDNNLAKPNILYNTKVEQRGELP